MLPFLQNISAIMKRIIFLFIASTFLLVQCDLGDVVLPSPKAKLDCSLDTDLCSITEANNAFGIRVLQGIHSEAEANENLFISPLSIATALTMTLNGASGQTQTDMMQTLSIGGMPLSLVNESYQKLLDEVPSLDPSVKLQLANSIWYKEGFPVEQSFLDTNAIYFQSQINAADFSDPATKDLINQWVKENTNGLIESIVEEIPPQMVMYLINAIYFKGSWRTQFDPEDTYQTVFKAPDRQIMTDMMDYDVATLPFYQNEDLMVADIPYGDSVYSMTVFLPKEAYSVNELIENLNGEKWTVWTSQLQDTEIRFAMPKFKISYKKKLNEILKTMGMSIAFTPQQADFSNLAPGELYIDEVMHKAFVEVNEEGTEAAAVTSVGIGVTSVPTYPRMILDRPFVFAIRENQTNEILFIGKLADPSKE